MAESKKCPGCGMVLPPDATSTHCPQCQLKLDAPADDVSGQGSPTIQVAPLSESSPIENPGDRISHYRLLQQIGEGGMGTVWMAEQEQPVRRRVALKVVKLGMDTKQVVARFEAERQALALMDHPNIAKVLDAGATDTGRPYFVMELVRGIKITDYCDQNNLSTSERLGLFIKVCQAIQHAHQKGIIHRDIKPSNILVTLNDGVPVPKVIDFGIAKATNDQRLTDKTLFTAFEQFIGTPAYMSPEQAEMSALDIDTRSDIYSLGVLLYELLTGKTPFETKDLFAAGLDAMRRMIREQEPPRPSTRLSTLAKDELTTTAKHRQADSPKLVHLIKGDLDWIVMKTLEKDRTRRYETANGLAADIQRHLNHEAVVARPPSNVYRFQKMVGRNKLAVGAAATIAAALLIGLLASTWEAVRANRAEQAQVKLREKSEIAEKKAVSEAAKSRQVAQFLEAMLDGVGPSVAVGRDTTLLREILDKTSAHLADDLKEQPEVEAELRSTLGQVYWKVGDLDKAEAMDQQALFLRQKILGKENAPVAQSMQRLGHVLWRKGKLKEAEAMTLDSLAMQRKIFGNESLEVASGLDDLAAIYSTENNYEPMVASLKEELSIKKKLFGSGNQEFLDAQADVVSMLAGFGYMNLKEAEIILRNSLERKRKQYGNLHPEVAGALSSLCSTLYVEFKSAEAEPLAREAVAIRKKISGNENPEVAQSLYNLANILQAQGKFAEAELNYRESLEIRKQKLGDESPELAQCVFSLACNFAYFNKPAEAEPLFIEAITRQRKLFTGTNLVLARSLYQLGKVCEQLGKFAEAEKSFSEAIAIRKNYQGNSGNAEDSLRHLGHVLLEQGMTNQAESAYLGLKGSFQAKADAGDLVASDQLARLLATCQVAKIRSGAQAVVLAEENAIATDRKNARVLDTLAAAYAEAGQFTNAIKTENDAMALLKTDADKTNCNSRLKLYEANSPFREDYEAFSKPIIDNQNPQTLNASAWEIVITSAQYPGDTNRILKAIAMAESAARRTQRKNPAILDTLAAAAAAIGDFPKAIATQNEAIALLNDHEKITDYKLRLRLYQGGKPYSLGN